MNLEEIRFNQSVQQVWEVRIFHSKKMIKRVEIKEITVAVGFFKSDPYIVSKGIGHMKKTYKEALGLLVNHIKNNDNLSSDLVEWKKVIVEEYPELLV